MVFGAVAQFGASFGAVALVDCRLRREVKKYLGYDTCLIRYMSIANP